MFGQHVDRNYAKGKRPCITQQIAEAKKLCPEMKSVQIFVSIPQSKNISLHEEEIAKLIPLTSTYPIVTHSSYTTTNCWTGNKESFDLVIKECEITARYHGVGVVVHLPKQPPALIKPVLDVFVKRLVGNMRLIIETPAHVPPNHYSTVDDLRTLINMIPKSSIQHFGLCLDTAHLWVAGQCMNEPAMVTKFLEDLDTLRKDTGIFIMWHLNDSELECGHGPDSHAQLTEGKIWDEDDSSLRLLIAYIIKHNDVAIFEIRDHTKLKWSYNVIDELTN